MILAATASPVLVFVHVLAASVWIGGLVTIGVVAGVARREFGEAERVAFFRALGRGHGVVGGAALVVALASGAVLLAGRRWDGTSLAAVALAAALVIATVAGVIQARAMTRLRQRALRDSGDTRLAAQLQRGAKRATLLRASIGALTLALLAVGAVLAG